MDRNSVIVGWLLLALGFSACSQSFAAASKGKILVVVSSADHLTLKDNKTHPTGFFLNELGVPVKALADEFYEPVFASPSGKTPVMDEMSDNARYFDNEEQEHQKIKSFVEGLPSFKHPRKLEEIAKEDLSQYAAIFVPGGHAPMEDLWRQPALGKILGYFHKTGKPTALICHGPIALLSTMPNAAAVVKSVEDKSKAQPDNWPYKGYRMTVFSDAEEKPNEPGRLGGFMKFYPEDALRAAGADVNVSAPKQPHMVMDRELITGQNPFSDNELAQTLVTAVQVAQMKAK